MTIPSPHVSEQELAVEESPKVQVYPVSTAHVELQPSLSLVLPSSQYPSVGLITFPSPQVSEQEAGVDESPAVQSNPTSTAQDELHPSLSIVFPSSQ